MVLRIAKTHFGEKVPITFPTEASKVWNEMSGLEEFGTYGTIKYIIGEGISEHFAGHITLADLNTEPGIQKINQLAELVDAMDDTTQKVFLGVLAAGSPASLDDILHAASKVGQYELIAEVSTDRELGEWLVNHGHLGTEISDTVRPYLDYPFIGAQYYKSHEGAYTPNGYVRLREPFPVLESAGPHTIQLTLTARSGELPLALPVTEAQLDQVKEALGIEDFAQVGVVAVSFSSQHLSGLIPLDAVTVEEANELAGWLQELDREDTGLMKFCAVLEVEQPDTFSKALTIAMDLDDHELIPADMNEYGRQVLQRIGADDELLDTIEGYMDFTRLGEDSMAEDGVRRTQFGLVRRLSAPYPQQEEIGPAMC